MKSKTFLARGLSIDGNAYIVRKRFKPLPTGGCTICGAVNEVSTYIVHPKKLLSSTTKVIESERQETWQMLPGVSMLLCNECVKDHSRHRVKRWIFLIPLFILISVISFTMVRVAPSDGIQILLKLLGGIASVGAIITLIYIPTLLPDKNQEPQTVDGQRCVRDLIRSQYTKKGYAFDLPTLQDLCQHEWKFERKDVSCSMDSSRGSGQYNDPCYGAACPCDEGKLVNVLVCSRCGAETKESIE